MLCSEKIFILTILVPTIIAGDKEKTRECTEVQKTSNGFNSIIRGE